MGVVRASDKTISARLPSVGKGRRSSSVAGHSAARADAIDIPCRFLPADMHQILDDIIPRLVHIGIDPMFPIYSNVLQDVSKKEHLSEHR